MGLFGSWFDDLFNGNGETAPTAPISTTPTQAPVPAPASPDAMAQLQALMAAKANPSTWQKIAGGLGGGLKDFAMLSAGHPEAANNISSYFGGVDQAKTGMLAQNALGQALGDANGGTDGQLPSDLPLKIAKLKMMGIDTSAFDEMLKLKTSMQPKYTKDDMGNIWAEVPGQPPKLITVGPGKAMSGKEPTVAINPYGGGGAAQPASGPSPPSGPPSGNAAAALDYFTKAGFSSAAAAGIVGNLQYESGLDPNKPTSTPGENGFGIAQWGPPRAQQFQQVMGKPLRGSSLQDQLAFTKWELTQGPYASVGNALKQTTDPRAATDLVLNKYENPAHPAASQATREGYATGYMGTPPAMLAQSGQTATDAPPGMIGSAAPYAGAAASMQAFPPGSPGAQLAGALQQGGSAAPQQSQQGSAHVLYDPGKEWIDPTPAQLKAHPGLSQVNAQSGEFKYAPASELGMQQFGGAQAAASNLHGQAYLQTVDPKIATQVKALAEGRMAFPSGFALRSGYWQNMLQAVSQFDPSFDAVNYNARAKTRNDFTSGKSAQNITSFNTAIGHLGTLNDSIDALNNTNYPSYNRFANSVSQESGDTRYQVARQKFDTAKQAVTDELTRAFRGSSGNVSDIDRWAGTLDAAQSPAALKSAVQQAIQLLHSRIDAVGDQYNRGMGTTADPLHLLSPKAQQTIRRLEGGSPGAPHGGAPAQVKTSADYNRLPKGATYIDPNGVQRTKQ